MMNKGRTVLHVPNCGLSFSGVPAVIFSIVENLHDEFDFDVVSPRAKGGREKEFLQYGKLRYLPIYGKPNLIEHITRPIVTFFGIYYLCKKYKYDVIHCHNEADAGICLKAAKMAGVRIRISHSHNTLSPKKIPFLKKIYVQQGRRLIRTYATSCIGCSKEACEALFGSDQRYMVLRNGIDFTKFDITKVDSDDNLRKKRLVHVGRYCFQKNQKFILEVVHFLQRIVPDVSMKLVGYGPDEDELFELRRSYGLEDTVELVSGKNADIPSIYAESGIMIFPSNYEGFGIALIEAQAMGVYCFCSDAITDDANIGMMEKIALDVGAQKWAERIYEYMLYHQIIDMHDVIEMASKFKAESIMKAYEILYSE